MDYNIHMIARAEHNEMARSLRPALEDGNPVKINRVGRASRHLLYALGKRLVSLGERMKRDQDRTPLMGQKRSGVTG